jgi:hypothetical protein
MLNCNLNKPQSFLQRQIRRPRMGRQALRSAAHHDHDCLPWASPQYPRAGLPRDGADALGENDLPVERNGEVRGEREEVGSYAGEGVAEAGSFGGEGCDGAAGEGRANINTTT